MYPRWLWPFSALPGVVWLLILFLLPLYAVLALAFGGVDPILLTGVPAWNPLDWNPGWVSHVLDLLVPGNILWDVFVRTCKYVAISLAGCILIGYPVAYYVARHASRTKSLLLILLVLPFWISYLMRMLAWINLLSPGGYGLRFLSATGISSVLHHLGIISDPNNYLSGQSFTVILALIYGYIPFFILPLYASLDRIDQSHLEAARDLGASPFRAFLHVTLPLSKTGLLGGAVLITLPMFGDYYTPNIVSGAPSTTMIGNQIDLYFHGGPQPTIGAAIPVLLAVQFSFNDSRSLSVWHGFTLKWYTSTDPNIDSVFHSAELHGALAQSLKLAGLDVLIATPIGVFLALGLARWRGRGSGASNFLMLFPLVTPEIVAGVSLLILFSQLLTFVPFGTVAQLLGHVTFSISYVVVIVRGRLFSIGPSYEEAAADLGAAPAAALYRVLLPLLLPAIVASAAIVFAISIDDFVISQWLSSGANSTTVPVQIYAATRATPEPSTDGIATVIMVITLLSVVAGVLVYRFFTCGESGRGSAVDDVAGLGI